ncbi:ATP/ADP translocase [Paenibacillus sp. UNCCL117]|uniref:Npt1/Npt2 family nucleotide transporter n=1 Tax=unclassified Paenibacillus TaxID=185978 RepID=UPI00087F1C4C|nr:MULTISPECIES: Npt1/Npt2 family nucleotide transporter [unclassified Paenibacillus]SDD77599.1 ATP/ADP translocase [Paenibacillus sp. cl123]SFW52769.1 ATP/ADP translocase [Paenibacillus sp. UNCCL117]
MGRPNLRKRLSGSLTAFTADREEYGKVLLLFGYLFCAVSASTIGRTAADAMFLSRFDSALLSKMYLPQALALMAAGVAYQRLGGRWRQDRLALAVIAGAGGLSLLSRAGVAAGQSWVFPVIYIGYDVLNFLMVVSFWQLAASVMDQRKAKRMIGLVGSGGIAGGIVSGFALKGLSGAIGTENLIYCYALLQLLCLVFVIGLARRAGAGSDLFASPSPSAGNGGKKGGAGGGSFRTFMEHVPHLKYVAIMSGAVVLSLVLIDYQFKVILKGTLQDDALAGFMGSFYGFSGLLALAVQLLVSGRLISRFGVMTALLLFPLALLAGSFGVLLIPVLAMAVSVKGTDKVLGDTVYSSVNQLIMFPVAPEWRGRAKGFLDGVARNGAKGLAALLLIALSPLLSAAQFSYLIMAALLIAVIAAIRLRGAYMQLLLRSLRTQDLDLQETRLDLMDPASRKLLTDAIASEDAAQALYALRVLERLEGFELEAHLPSLLRHSSAEVKRWALDWIRRHTPAGLEEEALRLTGAEEPVIRARAWLAVAAYAREEHLEPLTGLLQDQAIVVRSAGIAGLIQHYGIEGMFRAVGTLKELLDSPEEEERQAMAALFGELGLPSFYKPLLRLLQDESAQVRVRALESAAVLQVPELVQAIVPLLSYGSTRAPALHALASYEEAVILPLLGPYLQEAGHPAAPFLPQALALIGGQRASSLLLSVYGKADEELRGRLLDALVAIRAEAGFSPDEGAGTTAEDCAAAELERYWLYAHASEALAAAPELAEIAAAADEARLRTAERIFGLLALSYDPQTMKAVHVNWSGTDARRQASAAEVVDQLVSGRLRSSIAQMMAHASRPLAEQPDQATVHTHIAGLLETGEVWLRSVILASAAGLSADGAGGRLARWTADEHKQAAAEVERVRLLRSVSLFQGLTGRELAALGTRLREVLAAEGQPIITEGETGDALYVIREGSAEVLRGGQRLGLLAPGDCFGEMAVLTSSVRAATVRAAGGSRLWRLDSEDVYDLLFDHKEMALSLMAILSRRLRTVNREAAAAVAGPLADSGQTEAQSSVAAIAAGGLEAAAVELRTEPGRRQEAATSGAILRRILVLQRIDLFAHVSADDFVQLAGMVQEIRYEAGEAIVREGEPGDCLYGIIEGSVRVHSGGGQQLALLSSGDCFGEMALIDGEPRSASCTAAGPALLLRLPREQALSFCFTRLDVLKSMMRVLAVRLRDTQK